MDVIKAIESRRSATFFDSERRVPDDKIRKLLELAALSPSSFNLQPWEVIIVNDPKQKKILRRCCFDQEKVEHASHDIIIIADPQAIEVTLERVISDFEEKGYINKEDRVKKEGIRKMVDRLYGSSDSLKRKIFATKNASLFAMSLMIAAKGLGLETHAMDGFDEQCIKKEFGIPAEKIIPMIIAVGYKKDVTLLPRAFRKTVDEFGKWNHY